MLFMVTNRRFINGSYGDEEQKYKKFHYLYSYNKLRKSNDFEMAGKKGFEVALLAELKRIKKEDGISTPKVGNYLLRKGMEYLSDSLGFPAGRLLFNETIMMAPDISSKDIEIDGKGQYIANFSRRVHVYYSKHDRALKASSIKRFGGNRLGRHGANDYNNLSDNVIVINAKEYANKESISGYKDRANKQVSVHSSHRYHKNILSDVIQVLSSIDRDQIKGRKPVNSDGVPMNNHYKLV